MHADAWQGLMCDMCKALKFDKLLGISNILQCGATVFLGCCLLARTSVSSTRLGWGSALLAGDGSACAFSGIASRQGWDQQLTTLARHFASIHHFRLGMGH